MFLYLRSIKQITLNAAETDGVRGILRAILLWSYVIMYSSSLVSKLRLKNLQILEITLESKIKTSFLMKNSSLRSSSWHTLTKLMERALHFNCHKEY